MANFIANKLSELLFEKVGACWRPESRLKCSKGFISKTQKTKITSFDNFDIPNVDKLSLYGPDIVNTLFFEDCSKHGDLWYVVARSKEYGYVVGITRDASVTIFDLREKDKYLEYVTKEICPLALEESK